LGGGGGGTQHEPCTPPGVTREMGSNGGCKSKKAARASRGEVETTGKEGKKPGERTRGGPLGPVNGGTE